MGIIYEKAMKFKSKYSGSISFRLKEHSKFAEKYLVDGEKVLHVYCGCRDFFHTRVLVITDKRVMVAHKNLLFGGYCSSIDKNEICEIGTHKGIIWNEITLSTLTDLFCYIGKLTSSAAAQMKEEITKSTIINRTNSERRISRRKKSKTIEETNLLKKQIEMCRQLDALYREKYRTSESEIERQELRAKLWNNYNLYLSLTGKNQLQEEPPKALLLRKD